MFFEVREIIMDVKKQTEVSASCGTDDKEPELTVEPAGFTVTEIREEA